MGESLEKQGTLEFEGEVTSQESILPSLKELLKPGYGFTGVNYPCGCTWIKSFTDKSIVDEYKSVCEEHKEKGGPE